MARRFRTTARKSTGGSAPRKMLIVSKLKKKKIAEPEPEPDNPEDSEDESEMDSSTDEATPEVSEPVTKPALKPATASTSKSFIKSPGKVGGSRSAVKDVDYQESSDTSDAESTVGDEPIVVKASPAKSVDRKSPVRRSLRDRSSAKEEILEKPRKDSKKPKRSAASKIKYHEYVTDTSSSPSSDSEPESRPRKKVSPSTKFDGTQRYDFKWENVVLSEKYIPTQMLEKIKKMLTKVPEFSLNEFREKNSHLICPDRYGPCRLESVDYICRWCNIRINDYDDYVTHEKGCTVPGAPGHKCCLADCPGKGRYTKTQKFDIDKHNAQFDGMELGQVTEKEVKGKSPRKKKKSI